MKSCQLKLIHLLWWGVAAKCLDYLVAAPVTFTQNLLIWTCYLDVGTCSGAHDNRMCT